MKQDNYNGNDEQVISNYTKKLLGFSPNQKLYRCHGRIRKGNNLVSSGVLMHRSKSASSEAIVSKFLAFVSLTLAMRPLLTRGYCVIRPLTSTKLLCLQGAKKATQKLHHFNGHFTCLSRLASYH